MTQNTRKHARANCHRHRKPVESHSADVPNATIIKAAVPTVGTTRRSNASSAPTAPPAKQKAPENQALCQIPTLHRQSPLQAKEGRIQTTTASQPMSSEWENQAMSDIMSHTELNTELKISLALSVLYFFSFLPNIRISPPSLLLVPATLRNQRIANIRILYLNTRHAVHRAHTPTCAVVLIGYLS